jgi:hypothetical protein
LEAEIADFAAGADRQPENKSEILAMTETKPTLPAEIRGTEITRFNALKHGVLSRYTVLPWEDADEYRALVAALMAEHAPQGPTEEHLVEELAGILWRKRRLRLARSGRPSARPRGHIAILQARREDRTRASGSPKRVGTCHRCNSGYGGEYRGRHR